MEHSLDSNPDSAKVEALKKAGWYQMWHPDNWLDSKKDYSNPDWGGLSTDQAYEEMMKKK